MLSSQDTSLFQWFNGLSETSSRWNPYMIFFAEKAIYIMVLVLCIYWLLGAIKTKKMILQSLLSTGIALISGSIIAHFVIRDRPFVSLTVNKLIEHASDNSFPSDHTMVVFALAGTLILHRKWEGILWTIVAALVAISRVWCGIHYPGDVIIGAIIGLMSAWVVKTYLPAWGIVGILLTYILKLYNYTEAKTLKFAKRKLGKK